MLMLYEAILIAMHSYTLIITFRTMYYFYQKVIFLKKKLFCRRPKKGRKEIYLIVTNNYRIHF